MYKILEIVLMHLISVRNNLLSYDYIYWSDSRSEFYKEPQASLPS